MATEQPSRFRPGNAKRGADTIAAVNELLARHPDTTPFQGRGLDRRVIEALTAHGIDAPERLLFMRDDELLKIPGIGKAALEQVRRYRDRFIGAPASPRLGG
jgi:DNA-directed RNA polymerase alpha subunit